MKTTDDSLGPVLNRVMAFRRGDIVFIATAWSVEEKYEKYKKVFATVLAPLQSQRNSPPREGTGGFEQKLPGPKKQQMVPVSFQLQEGTFHRAAVWRRTTRSYGEY